MSAETLYAPCTYLTWQTWCLRDYLKKGFSLPCELYSEGTCRPYEYAILLQQDGFSITQIGNLFTELNILHYKCPISSLFIFTGSTKNERQVYFKFMSIDSSL